MNPVSMRRMMHFRNTFELTQRCVQNIRVWIFAHTEKDVGIILFVILLALILRVPFLSHPRETLFDEVVYANFVVHIIQGVPFFDIHPPFARILFAEVANLVPFHAEAIPIAINQSFQNFPYVLLRFFTAFFGVLLAPLIYMVGRAVGYIPRIAIYPALFVVFDNALVLYSRAILPDTILLVLAFSGFLAAFAATKEQAGLKRRLFVFVSACLLGLAVSIKWTALGVFGVVVLVFFLSRMYREIVWSTFTAIAIYVLIFTSFLFYFPQGGRADYVLPPYNVPIVTGLEFPESFAPQTIAPFLAAYHRAMLETNRDVEITEKTLKANGPLSWPVAKSSIAFWKGGDGKQIILMGNSILWFAAFFTLLFELAWIALHFLRERRWPINRTESILLAGYTLNYIPFFFIDRSMYLYHYFIALLFLFLLVPRIAPRIVDCITCVSGDRLFAQTLACFVGFLMLLNFFLLAPTTYGF
ncbi:MAG: phospholipid carrier-dependent glycosyltransferase [Patescibacteria group bacterium]